MKHLAHAAKRPDGIFDDVIVLKRHVAKPFPARLCCQKPDTTFTSKKAGDFSARPFDMNAFRRVLPDRWAQFCRAHFRNSLELAIFFDTDEKTARNWLSGKHIPSGAYVLRAVTSFPDAIPCLLGGDC